MKGTTNCYSKELNFLFLFLSLVRSVLLKDLVVQRKEVCLDTFPKEYNNYCIKSLHFINAKSSVP